MNSTSSVKNSQSATWKNVKARYIAAVCGLALAAGAIAGIVTLSSQDSANSSGRPGLFDGTTIGATADLPVTSFFIVRTQEQALALQHSLNESLNEYAMGFSHANVPERYEVVVADSPEQDRIVSLMVQELNGVALQTGLITANVIDLR